MLTIKLTCWRYNLLILIRSCTFNQFCSFEQCKHTPGKSWRRIKLLQKNFRLVLTVRGILLLLTVMFFLWQRFSVGASAIAVPWGHEVCESQSLFLRRYKQPSFNAKERAEVCWERSLNTSKRYQLMYLVDSAEYGI